MPEFTLHAQCAHQPLVQALRASVHISTVICYGELGRVLMASLSCCHPPEEWSVVSSVHHTLSYLESVVLLNRVVYQHRRLLSKQSDPFVFFSKRSKVGLNLKYISNVELFLCTQVIKTKKKWLTGCSSTGCILFAYCPPPPQPPDTNLPMFVRW